MADENCCSPKPNLRDRPLITHEQSNDLEDMFKVLSNGTRLRILHALIRTPEISVGELAESVDMKPQAVSNQLQRLMDRGIVTSRRNGNFIHYTILDPCIVNLLDRGLCLIEDTKELNANAKV